MVYAYSCRSCPPPTLCHVSVENSSEKDAKELVLSHVELKPDKEAGLLQIDRVECGVIEKFLLWIVLIYFFVCLFLLFFMISLSKQSLGVMTLDLILTP